MPPADPLAEGRRILTICNACRYCEGYCAVFPAMESRQFNAPDLHYLANLCHNCAECYYACQYAPPHEFAVNVPQVLAQIRLDSYRHYARPRSLFSESGRLALAVLTLSLLVMFLVAGTNAGTFYQVIPHSAMVGMFGAAALLILGALVGGVMRQVSELPIRLSWSALKQGARSVLTLEYLSSGGVGCTYPDAHHSQARRWFHHCAFYGFGLCFASTTVAAWYHYVLARRAPYPYLSLPVLLGMLGGIGLLIGPVGLYLLKRRRDQAIVDARQDGLDITFLSLLFATSLTGLLLLLLRNSSLMGPLLVIHLSVVLALFMTLPYGKFVHGLHRGVALLRYAVERGVK